MGEGISVDADGNVFIAGGTSGTGSAGSWDAILTKLDASGNTLSSKQVGGSGSDIGYSTTVDMEGNSYLSGWANQDAFVVKYDPFGNELWSEQLSTPDLEGASGVSVDKYGDIWLTGSMTGDMFGPNAGDYDAFLVRFAIPEPMTMSLIAIGGIAILRRRSR